MIIHTENTSVETSFTYKMRLTQVVPILHPKSRSCTRINLSKKLFFIQSTSMIFGNKFEVCLKYICTKQGSYSICSQ